MGSRNAKEYFGIIGNILESLGIIGDSFCLEASVANLDFFA